MLCFHSCCIIIVVVDPYIHGVVQVHKYTTFKFRDLHAVEDQQAAIDIDTRISDFIPTIENLPTLCKIDRKRKQTLQGRFRISASGFVTLSPK